MRSGLAVIHEEGAEIIRAVARREPAKVIALRTGMTPRHVYNLREGECQPGWMHFIALAQNYPELRAAIGRWLGFGDAAGPRAREAMLDRIRRIVACLPEEGDQAQADAGGEEQASFEFDWGEPPRRGASPGQGRPPACEASKV